MLQMGLAPEIHQMRQTFKSYSSRAFKLITPSSSLLECLYKFQFMILLLCLLLRQSPLLECELLEGRS